MRMDNGWAIVLVVSFVIGLVTYLIADIIAAIIAMLAAIIIVLLAQLGSVGAIPSIFRKMTPSHSPPGQIREGEKAMKRDLIASRDNGDMLVVDENKGMFGESMFFARIISTEMRPTTICRTIGRADTRINALQLFGPRP